MGISQRRLHYYTAEITFLPVYSSSYLTENISKFFSLPVRHSHLPSSSFHLLSSLPVCLQREVSRPISRWIQYWKIGKFNIKKLFEAAEWCVLPPEMEESKEALGNAA